MTENTYSTTANMQTESRSIVKEPKAPEGTLLRQVQDAKESITVLKNQVSFANQCLSLLRNQMKHASDTLNILQDQVDLAQRTVSTLTEGSATGLAIPQPQSAFATAGASKSQTSWVSPTETSDEQKVIVHDSEGPKVYTLSKSSMSLGDQNALASDCATSHEHGQVPCVVHQVPVHCHCPACLSHANVHHVPPAFHPQCHASPARAIIQVGPDVPPPPHHAASMASSHVVVMEPTNVSTSLSQSSPTSKSASGQEESKNSSGEDRSSSRKESASTSPMAHQLLQVIDVLQTVDDEVGSSCRSTTLSSMSRGVPVGYATTGDHLSIPYGGGAASFHKFSRRHRKQSISPAKVISSESLTSVFQEKNSSVKTVLRDHLELMRVPAPVLAATLEPEFLVVPSSSYSYDSPPASATDRLGKEEDRKKKTKPFTESLSAETVVSSSASREETHVPPEQSSGAPDGKGVSEECRTEGSCRRFDDKSQPSRVSSDSRGYVSLTSLPEKNQQTDLQIDTNGLCSPNRRFTGTSPLNSDVGMPFMCPKTEAISTALNNTTEPVSLAAVVSQLEHAPEKSPVLSTTCHMTASQAPPMAVISLANNVESAVTPQKVTSPTKKPIILSRRSSRSSEQNIPQGLVVLVPTIEDAKRLIASTGGSSDGHTPVLVPQHMLNEIHAKNAVSEDDRDVQRQILGKRSRDMVSPPRPPQPKRSAVDSVVID